MSLRILKIKSEIGMDKNASKQLRYTKVILNRNINDKELVVI